MFKFLIHIMAVLSLGLAPRVQAMSTGTQQAVTAAGMILGVAVVTKIKTCNNTATAAVCAMAVATAVSAVTSLADAKKSRTDTTCVGSSCYGGGGGDLGGSGGDGGTGPSGAQDETTPNGLPPGVLPSPYDQMTLEQIEADLSKKEVDLAAKGYSVDGDQLKTPHGSIKTKDMGNSTAMQKAGFGEDEISASQKALKDMESNLKNLEARFGTDESDYDQGSASIRGVAGGHLKFGEGQRRNQLRPSTAGLSKSDGRGGAIGVSGDDLFHMVTRRYLSDRSAGKFLNSSDGQR